MRVPGPEEAVQVLRHVWIPLGDGTRLAARIWMPAGAEAEPRPVILEYIPYRKNDATAPRDNSLHARFAGAGYVAVRVDLRGSGDSDGQMQDEYAPLELSDGAEVIDWLSKQPWCDGNVGMIGKSWGGFNGLQIAALRPRALKAIVTVCSTDDRYADDVHYTGGALIASEMLPWAATMLAYNARPADPAVVGTGWREQWLRRMDETPPYVQEWLSHQARDAYWKHASVCEDYSAIEAAVLAVGGWYDSYCGAILRLLEGLDAPARGLIGPWAHNYPHQGIPGPAIDFHEEVVRWFDHWMRGRDTGVMDEPALRAWMPEWAPPGSDVDERPGRWVAEETWPSPRVAYTPYPLSPAGGPEATLHSPRTIGAYGGSWLQFGDAAGQFLAQGADDGLSYTSTTAPLEERVEILGEPAVTLRVSADRPAALLAVRLCDVAPDGSSRLITRGLLNLTHRDGHERPVPLEPGEPYEVTVPLLATAHAFASGHRIRVAVSASYWPLAWPSPEPVTVTLLPGGSSALHLPVRPVRAEDAELRPFGPPSPDLPAPFTADGTEPARTIEHDTVTGRITITLDQGGTDFTDHTDGSYRRSGAVDRFSLTEGDPSSAVAECERTEEIGRGDWNTRIVTRSRMTGDASAFSVTDSLTAYEGEEQVFHRTWNATIPRKGV